MRLNELELPPSPCPRCGRDMRRDTVKTAIWLKERLVVVEDVPAQVCDACVEQFYDEWTTDALRRWTEAGFPPDEAKREIVVQVYSLAGRIQWPEVVPSWQEVIPDD